MFELDVGASRDPGNIGLDYVRGVGSFSVSDTGLDLAWVHDRYIAGAVRMPGEWTAPVVAEETRNPSGKEA